MTGYSINKRIIIAAGIVVLIFISLTGLALENAFRDSARSAMKSRLQGQIYMLMGSMEVDETGQVSMPPLLPEPRFNLPGSGLYARILDEQDKIHWQSRSLSGVQQPFKNNSGHYIVSMNVQWAATETRHPFRFQVAEDLAPYSAQINQYRNSLWSWLGVMGILLLLIQFMVLRWGMAPLRTAADELRAIKSGGQQKMQQRYPIELEKLTNNINTLLDHERARQTRFSNALSDLAHSLKTPLAVIRANLGGSSQGQENIEQQIQHMDDIVNYQLQRAATEGHTPLNIPLRLNDLIHRIISSLEAMESQKEITLKTDIADSLVVRGNEGDLLELFGNLLDNAWKWCRKTVSVSAQQQHGQLLVLIEDDGPGIPEDAIESLLARGKRADSQIPGHGLGLAIVSDIVSAYQGKLSIDKSALGGCCVRLQLPLECILS